MHLLLRSQAAKLSATPTMTASPSCTTVRYCLSGIGKITCLYHTLPLPAAEYGTCYPLSYAAEGGNDASGWSNVGFRYVCLRLILALIVAHLRYPSLHRLSLCVRYDTPDAPTCYGASDSYYSSDDTFGYCECASTETQNTNVGCTKATASGLAVARKKRQSQRIMPGGSLKLTY